MIKGKVTATLKKCHYQIIPKQSQYDYLEVKEFWTFSGKKTHEQWLIYAYYRAASEIVACI